MIYYVVQKCGSRIITSSLIRIFSSMRSTFNHILTYILFWFFLRLGFLVDFLSHAAIVGFVAGAAIIIGLQQLKGLFGITHFPTSTDVISVMEAVWSSFHHPVVFFSFLYDLKDI